LQAVKKYSETELVDLLKQRQKSAFNYLYDKYAGSLYSIITNIVPDNDLANDVLQEVFIKIWRQIERYDSSKGTLFTWLLNIARNSSIDLIRSKNYQNYLVTGELTESIDGSAYMINTAIENIGLRAIVNRLKNKQKILIQLSFFEGFSHEEISNMLKLPLGTVKTRLRSVLIKLREAV
jgi:RNA polymerase sigma factor (sigma-70 family)